MLHLHLTLLELNGNMANVQVQVSDDVDVLLDDHRIVRKGDTLNITVFEEVAQLDVDSIDYFSVTIDNETITIGQTKRMKDGTFKSE